MIYWQYILIIIVLSDPIFNLTDNIFDNIRNGIIRKSSITRQVTIDDITYIIYTRDNNKTYADGDVIPAKTFKNKLQSTRFNFNLKTYFVIHGWNERVNKSKMHTVICPQILKYHNVNVIYVDWSAASTNILYAIARNATKPIGNLIGDDINFMIDTLNYPSSRISLIGNSLGAHVAGAAGTKSRSRIYTIIGLDPAKPLFNYMDINNRLDMTDAKFVHVTHTDGNTFGFFETIGHADYYPNGGRHQPGCEIRDISCSHGRAVEYFAESLNSKHVFEAWNCTNYIDYINGQCFDNHLSRLGQLEVDRTASGKYYLKTASHEPYAIKLF